MTQEPFTYAALPGFHSPDAADSTTFDVQLGDIILTATDGLFDNMPDYMILQELKKLKVTSVVLDLLSRLPASRLRDTEAGQGERL